jgi:DivIVA domain-containing protein
MTSDENRAGGGDRRISPADLHHVRFTRATMLRPGYSDTEVDHFLYRVADELTRLHAEKAALRDRVHALQAQLDDVPPEAAISDQAVLLLATAQQTADSYVAEAEDFSRQMTSDARAQYEEQLRRARDSAGAIIQAAQEAAARMVGGGPAPVSAEPRERSTQELEEQVAYLKAFGQACRTQLRAYLEALLTDVETEWGRADPASLVQAPLRTPAQRASQGGSTALNVAREVPMDDGPGGESGVEVAVRR